MNQHARIVTSLYRKLLKQHRMLPLELQGLGVQYIKDEFRRHKGADSGQATIFLNEWRMFSDILDEQLRRDVKSIGTDITRNLESFSDEQIAQLYELQQATQEVGKEGDDAKK